jgi:hypothetical protein
MAKKDICIMHTHAILMQLKFNIFYVYCTLIMRARETARYYTPNSLVKSR